MKTLDIIYFRDLKSQLPYRDARSISDYLHRNNVEILGAGKTRYVLAAQLHRAQLSERINHLKIAFSDNWLQVLKSEMSLCAKLQSTLDEIEQDTMKPVVKQKANPRSKTEQHFLNEINKELLDNNKSSR